MYLNSQSIVNKIEELITTTHDLKPDIICICETWCHAGIDNSFLNIPGYKLIEDLRKDRSDTVQGVGGGLLVYVRNGLAVFIPSDNNIDFIQYCTFQIELHQDTVNICLVYRSPNSSNVNNTELNSLLLSLPKNSLIIGDFNYPNIDWNTFTSSSANVRQFLDIVINKDYSQIIDFPTHVRGNTLDLLLTDLPSDSITVSSQGRLGKSDHNILLVKTRLSAPESKTTEQIPQWNRANFPQIINDLESVNWSAELLNCSAQEAWDLFSNKANETISRNVPFRPRRQTSKPIWMNSKCLQAVRKKRKLWKRYKQCNTQQLFSDYKKQEKVTHKLCKQAKKTFEKKLSTDQTNTRKFFAYVNSRKSVKASVGPLVTEQGTVSESKDMANVLNTYFASVFTDEDTNNMPEVTEAVVEPLETVIINERKILDKIDKLKNGSAPGPDGMAVIFLKKTRLISAKILKVIFEKSLDTGIVPSQWKTANITPIFKNSGSKSDSSKYRPVSLTCVGGKIMESLLKDMIVEHLQTNNLINPSQHGFMPHKSCTTNLLEFLEIVTKLFDEGKSVDLMYLDFSKAFDKVPRKRLILKIKAHGIKGKLLAWIDSWLSDRKQRVVLNGEASEWEDSKSGVPQGSLLGPIFYIVYNNDMDGAVVTLTTSKKFADDSKGAQAIRCAEDRDNLQGCIDNLGDWCSTWGMEFNASKCKIIHIGRNNPGYDYSMNGEILQNCTNERDIGFNMDRSLKPSTHCNIISRKAHGILSLISRNFHYRDKTTFVNLYCQHVRPILEFASPVWSPWLEGDKKVIENVQRRMVRMISGLQGQNYEEKLLEIGLQSLQCRRDRADMIQVFKIIKGFDDVDYKDWFQLYGDLPVANRPATRLSNDPLNIIMQRSTGDVRKHFFSQRVTPRWNSLPTEVKNSVNVKIFKSSLDRLH